MIIRRETTADIPTIRAVHAAAFGRDAGGVTAEVTLIDELREGGDAVARLSLVAEEDGQVVGHVMCSRGHIDGRPAIGLGPLGVAPGHQRRGIGQALMHAALAAADALDEPCVALLGHVSYYPRFGFGPAESSGVLPPDPAWGEHFQLRRLTAWTDALRGTFRYAPAFDRL